MLLSGDRQLMLFRVDQFGGIALGVLRDVDQSQFLVAILGITSHVFDILPAELRAHSEVLLELNDGSGLGRFALKRHEEFSQLASFSKTSTRYPLRATIHVERSALPHWDNQAYWPTMLGALGLGLAFGLLLTSATTAAPSAVRWRTCLGGIVHPRKAGFAHAQRSSGELKMRRLVH